MVGRALHARGGARSPEGRKAHLRNRWRSVGMRQWREASSLNPPRQRPFLLVPLGMHFVSAAGVPTDLSPPMLRAVGGDVRLLWSEVIRQRVPDNDLLIDNG